jgi:hypothetical protein
MREWAVEVELREPKWTPSPRRYEQAPPSRMALMYFPARAKERTGPPKIIDIAGIV